MHDACLTFTHIHWNYDGPPFATAEKPLVYLNDSVDSRFYMGLEGLDIWMGHNRHASGYVNAWRLQGRAIQLVRHETPYYQ